MKRNTCQSVHSHSSSMYPDGSDKKFFRKGQFTHIFPYLVFHFLRCIMHCVNTGTRPAYLKNTVQLAAARQSRSDLRSSSTSAYLLPRLKTMFAECAFSHAGPSAWNALPTHVHDVPDSNTIIKLLRTHFFSLAFNVY